MKQYLSSVSEKGQVTLPLEIRKALGVKPKDKVSFRLEEDGVKVVLVGSPLESSFQVVPPLKKNLSYKEMVEIAAEEHAQHVAHSFLGFVDALNVAHMERAKITAIYSFDRDFDRIPGVDRIEPSTDIS